MVDAIKKMDKKFLIIVGCIVLIPITIIIILALIQGCGNKKLSYEQYEDKMISSAEKYFEAKKVVPANEGETATVELSTLVENGYIKPGEKVLDDATCTGSVTVRRNGASIEENKGGYLNYTVDLKCDNYTTTTIFSKLKESLVTEGPGLYETDIDYVFKGEGVKNYVDLLGTTFRVVSVDKNGIMKLIKTTSETSSRSWDTKYNVETKRADGINIYKDSFISKLILSDYKNAKKYNSKMKKHMMTYNVCVGKRASTDMSINKNADCSETLDGILISLVNASDFARASLDPNCLTMADKSCSNYNYLSTIALSTWTLNAVTDNSYDVLYLGDGVVSSRKAGTHIGYVSVIYVDGNEKYISGTGSQNSPFVLE